MPKPGELDRLSIEQQLITAHLDGANADVEAVGIGDALAISQRDCQRIQVRV